MTTSSKIPATDRSAGGPGSSHSNRDKAPQDSAGARHQHDAAENKHPNEQRSTGGGGTKHEGRHPGEGRRG
jgi:hypothetical protein